MSNIRILAPNKEFNGTRYGVPFLHGKAEVPVDFDNIGYFVKRGYLVEFPENGIYDDDIPFDEPTVTSLEDYTVAELKEYADEREIDLGKVRRKADIIAVLIKNS